MAVFLLVHGSWHGAWCWRRVGTRLTSEGHRVVAIDLPGHGEDRTPSYRITFGAYSRAVRAAAAACATPVIVAGHSMGGMVITQAVADAPDLFSAMIYVCAYVPVAGESVLSLSRLDPTSLVPRSVTLRPTSVRIKRECAKSVFYADCTAEESDWAIEQLCPEPLLPQFGKLRMKSSITLPRAYVECTQDRALSISRQRAMAERACISRIVSMKSGHSPFLSAAGELARHLVDLSNPAT